MLINYKLIVFLKRFKIEGLHKRDPRAPRMLYIKYESIWNASP